MKMRHSIYDIESSEEILQSILIFSNELQLYQSLSKKTKMITVHSLINAVRIMNNKQNKKFASVKLSQLFFRIVIDFDICTPG